MLSAYLCVNAPPRWLKLLFPTKRTSEQEQKKEREREREGCDKENNLTAEDRGVI